MKDLKLSLSAIDEERFGIRTARARNVAREQLPDIMDFCQTNDVKLLIARTSTTRLDTVQRMEALGFRLMDTLIYYTFDLRKKAPPENHISASIRSMHSGEEDIVIRIATEAFQGYYGHYHADPRLDQDKCDEAYVSWASRSATSRELVDEVLVAHFDGEIMGFITLRMNNPQEGEAVLGGVLAAARGRGIYRSFIIRGLRWCRDHGAERMLVSTQITNVPVQKVWARLGFEFSHGYYTFHKWFDEEAEQVN